MVKCVCENCGKEYEVRPYRIKEGSKYCSRKCFYEALRKNKENRIKKEVCIFCGKEFEWLSPKNSKKERLYCSATCCAKHHNQKLKEQRIKCVCLYCGKSFERPISRIKIGEYKYCSQECAKKDRIGKSKPHKQNDIFYEKDYAYMILSYKGETRKVIFDKEDEEKIKKYYWLLAIKKDKRKTERPCIFANKYISDGARGHINFWRYIMDYSGELQIDHINRNPLDNRKQNLRIVSAWTNSQNKEKKYGYSGICFSETLNRYRTDISYQGKKKFIGYFKKLEEAIEARKQAEKNLGCK